MTYVLHENGGTIAVADGALSQIVVRAAEAVDGARVRRRRKLGLTVDGEGARIEVGLAVAYGLVLPEVAHEVQRRVAEALRRMCGLEACAVDVSVEELER